MKELKEQSNVRRPLSLITVLLSTNFALFVLLISPLGRSRGLYNAIHEAGLAVWLTALPLWFGGTTLFVTALFFWKAIKKPNQVSDEKPKNTRLDGLLLLAWWIVLILACMYAFMMGMGG